MCGIIAVQVRRAVDPEAKRLRRIRREFIAFGMLWLRQGFSLHKRDKVCVVVIAVDASVDAAEIPEGKRIEIDHINCGGNLLCRHVFGVIPAAQQAILLPVKEDVFDCQIRFGFGQASRGGQKQGYTGTVVPDAVSVIVRADDDLSRIGLSGNCQYNVAALDIFIKKTLAGEGLLCDMIRGIPAGFQLCSQPVCEGVMGAFSASQNVPVWKACANLCEISQRLFREIVIVTICPGNKRPEIKDRNGL